MNPFATIPPLTRVVCWTMLLAASGWATCTEAWAQRPFKVYDPFYQQETARRTFHSGLALTGEVSYRGSSRLEDGLASAQQDPLGVALRVDYQLASRFDISAIIDASGSGGGRTLSLAWVVLKYYDCIENQDCLAVRLAVDPVSDSRLGFPQLDLALITTTFLSPRLSNNFVVGLRRVRIGYTQFSPAVDPPSSGPQVSPFTYTRALGTELNLMSSGRIHVDPAGSNLFLSLLGHVGQYELVASPLRQSVATEPESAQEAAADRPTTTTFRGAVIWGRAGLQYNRPSWQFAPFLGIPIHQWMPSDGDWVEASLQLGVRLMLR